MFAAIFGLFKGWSFLSSIGGWIADAWGWAVKNPLAALVTAMALIIAVLLWLHHHDQAAITKARADQAQAQKALKVEQDSNALLTAQIDRQNAAVAALGADSAKSVAQGNRDDDAAVARSAARAAQSARIIVPPPTPVQPDCRTPDSVVAVMGGL